MIPNNFSHVSPGGPDPQSTLSAPVPNLSRPRHLPTLFWNTFRIIRIIWIFLFFITQFCRTNLVVDICESYLYYRSTFLLMLLALISVHRSSCSFSDSCTIASTTVPWILLYHEFKSISTLVVSSFPTKKSKKRRTTMHSVPQIV